MTVASFGAWAGPQEDYIAGEKAYRQGDLSRAMTDLRRAADAGHAKAQALLGEILDQAESNEEAVAYFRKAAEQGDADGEFGLAGMYAAGEGVKKDPQEALRWFVRAADHGHLQALKVVAGAYIYGEFGLDDTARSTADAAKWIQRAAEAEFLPAVESLARAYRSGGYGIAPDAKLAEVWEAKLHKLRPPVGSKARK
jgi:uncharacterized protein